MERLTYWCPNGQGGGEWRVNIDGREERGLHVDRLAAYEDTWIGPEEIKATFTPEAVIKLAAQALGTTPDRLRELAQADREKNDPLTLDELRGMRGRAHITAAPSHPRPARPQGPGHW